MSNRQQVVMENKMRYDFKYFTTNGHNHCGDVTNTAREQLSKILENVSNYEKLNDDELKEYKDLLSRRNKATKDGDKVTAGMLKILCNEMYK